MSPIETVISVIPARFHRVVTGSAVAFATLVTGAVSAGATSLAAHPAILDLQVAVSHWPGRPGYGAARPCRISVPEDHASPLEIVLTAAVTTGAARAVTPQRERRRAPRRIAIRLLRRYGWRHYQFRYLDRLWSRESGWRVRARNPASGAYGIPQAVPGARMAVAGPNWRTSARTQILWGLEYIKRRYGSPHRAWKHELAAGWY